MTRTSAPNLIVRAREPRDLPALDDLLVRQQPHSEYPLLWPMPCGARAFIVRPSEVHAWVAELDGAVVGHISVTRVAPTWGEDQMAHVWAAGHGGVDVSELRVISVLFTDPATQGQGVGSALFAAAVEKASEEGYPALDVVTKHEDVVGFYKRRGFRIVGEHQTDWVPGKKTVVHLMVLPRNPAKVKAENARAGAGAPGHVVEGH